MWKLWILIQLFLVSYLALFKWHKWRHKSCLLSYCHSFPSLSPDSLKPWSSPFGAPFHSRKDGELEIWIKMCICFKTCYTTAFLAFSWWALAIDAGLVYIKMRRLDHYGLQNYRILELYPWWRQEIDLLTTSRVKRVKVVKILISWKKWLPYFLLKATSSVLSTILKQVYTVDF